MIQLILPPRLLVLTLISIVTPGFHHIAWRTRAQTPPDRGCSVKASQTSNHGSIITRRLPARRMESETQRRSERIRSSSSPSNKFWILSGAIASLRFVPIRWLAYHFGCLPCDSHMGPAKVLYTTNQNAGGSESQFVAWRTYTFPTRTRLAI